MILEFGATQLKIVARRKDGGGTIRVPILRTATVDKSKTSGGGQGTTKIDVDDLNQIVSNFGNRPVPVGFGDHKSFGERGGIHEAFVTALRVTGEYLFADIELTSQAFQAVVSGLFRAFSVEIAKNRVTPTEKLTGWSIHGGIFTNRPAIPIHFSPPEELAASEVLQCSTNFTVKGDGESNMKTVEELTAELEAAQTRANSAEEALNSATSSRDQLSEQVASLTSKAKRLEDELAARESLLRSRDNTITDFKSQLENLSEQMDAIRKENAEVKASEKSRAIVETIKGAVAKGVLPALFDGYKDDPCAWLSERYGGSLEGLQASIKGLIDNGLVKKVSGEVTQMSTDDLESRVELDEAEAAVFDRRFNGDTTFVGITSEAEARKAFASKGTN